MSIVHGVRRHAFWLLPVLAAALVGTLGARLIVLGVGERSAQLRRSAQSVVWRHAGLIEAELVGLASEARQSEAERAGVASASARAASFTMDARGMVLRTTPAEAAGARALAAEWARLPAQRRGAAVLFGPVRYGSRWIVAAAEPEVPTTAPGVAPIQTWSVSYESLDEILAHARFGRLVGEGYDFQLSQPDPLSPRPRIFLTSQQGSMADAATSLIRQPGAVGFAGTPFLRLAIRPHGGWYPVRELTAEIGLLALLTWAVAFGVYDLTHSLKRTRVALAASRQRLHALYAKLAREIEQRESLQRSFEHARYHDAFTGLPNRRYFMDQVDRALREIRMRRRQRIAIALVDIERLRLISDTLGHTAGDELLLQAAQRCAQALRESEHVLARWGPDQLAVLLYGVSSTGQARELADQLQQQAQGTYELRQHRLNVSARVGFTCVESGVQRAEELVREADLALVAATQQQAVHALPYAYGMAGAAVSLVSLEADLYVALDRREFRLLFQPIVDLQVGRVVGAEALLRWRHPVEGLLTPDKFLAIAEEAGLIVPVTRWIIQRVCRLAAEWRERLPEREDFYISVNLSAAVLRSPGLREYVEQVLAETHIPATHLKFELAEGGLISNVAAARAILDAFHNMGIQLMLDDFGTGYSSLSYLQLFPFDYVKIDRPFVSRTGSERANNAITAAILQVASNLGLQAVAEVVETKAAAQTLAQMGCGFGQGYFFSPPVDAEAAFQQLRSTSSVAMSQSGSEPEILESAGQEDDSPTVMLPAGMILESRIHDDSVSPEDASTAGR